MAAGESRKARAVRHSRGIRGLAAVLALAGLVAWPSLARADAITQTDGRDYEALAVLPTNSLVAIAYFRDQSSSSAQSYSLGVGTFRGVYVLRCGPLAIVPLSVYLPMIDLTGYSPLGTLHESGFDDLVYNPTIGYVVTEDAQHDAHTVFALTQYLTMPTGHYDAALPVNIGEHRWKYQPEIAVAQRYRNVTAEAVGNVSFHGDNPDFAVPMVGTRSLGQKPTFGADFHLTADLAPAVYAGVSYYIVANGRSSVDLSTPAGTTNVTITDQATVQTLRFTIGVRFSLTSLLLLQFNQDVAASNDATISRFFGIRFSQVFPGPLP
jgi:hypothetical protein